MPGLIPKSAEEALPFRTMRSLKTQQPTWFRFEGLELLRIFADSYANIILLSLGNDSMTYPKVHPRIVF